MKGILEFLAMFSLGRVFGLVQGLVKNFLATLYVGVIDGMRHIYFLVIATIAAVFLFFCGFLMIHVALFVYLPWSQAEKIFLLVSLGLVYMFVPLIMIACVQSRSRWIKASGLKKILDDVINKP